jgi:putative transposase
LLLKHDPYRYRRKLPHLQLGPPLFVSFSTHQRWILPPLARTIVFQSCMHEHARGVQIHALVVMPEHVHFLLTVKRDQNGNPIPFYQILGAIKSASAHRINKALHRKGKVWVNEAFDRMLREGEYEDCIDYIVQNPVRRGLVQDPDDYEWLWYERENEARDSR